MESFKSIEFLSSIYDDLFEKYKAYLKHFEGELLPQDIEFHKVLETFQNQFKFLMEHKNLC